MFIMTVPPEADVLLDAPAVPILRTAPLTRFQKH
jgi:hypothetical protein